MQTPATMPSPRGQQASGPIGSERWAPVLATVVARIVRTISRHWLLLFNTALGVLAFLPILPPMLMASGHDRVGRFLYAFLGLTCHQLPERSFFLFGPRLVYTLQQLEHLLGPDVPLRFIGDATTGFKVAVCERDTAMYLAMFVGGMVFALIRHRLRPLSWKGFLVLCAPMAADGLGQLVSLWESTPWSRVVTGSLFGIACIWLVCPHVERAMHAASQTLEADQQYE